VSDHISARQLIEDLLRKIVDRVRMSVRDDAYFH
jgi:hypothetical protein